jgi:hypothetical protein
VAGHNYRAARHALVSAPPTYCSNRMHAFDGMACMGRASARAANRTAASPSHAARAASSTRACLSPKTTPTRRLHAASRLRCGTQTVRRCSPNHHLPQCKFAPPPASPPPGYPCRFMCHFAVYPDGRVCISILHSPGDDPHGYESAAERWSPVQSVSCRLHGRLQ